MTAMNAPASRSAYHDPRLCFDVHHIIMAAHLVSAGYPMLYVRMVGRRSVFVFDQAAAKEWQRLNQLTDELAAHRQLVSRDATAYRPPAFIRGAQQGARS
jgi:hypothetical protein